MLFPTALFALFFIVVATLHWTLPERSLARKIWLFAASVFFYAWWSWRFALMMLASALVNHGFALAIARARHGGSETAAESPEGVRRAKRLLVLCIVLDLLLLAVFKYARFLVYDALWPILVPLCRAMGEGAVDALIAFHEAADPILTGIVLPIGLSFYTFQAIAYVVDVHRGTVRPAASWLDFANFLAFFPKLTSGPIVRTADFLPQMETLPSRDTPVDTGRAVTLVIGGLIKKMVVANWLASHLVDPFFSAPEDFGVWDALLGSYGYAIQLYCDFSAYSDIATGCALLLGFRFPDNFRAPYIATSIQDFWRRWHISLSSWLRDYLYIPFGGSRCAPWKVHRNLLLTMLLGGLWHGASWAFLLWGVFHGLVQCIERLFRKSKKADPVSGIRRIVAIVFTFHIATFAWILFRCGFADMQGFETFRAVLGAFGRAAPSALFSAMAVGMLLLGYALQALDGDTPRRIWNAFNRLPVWARALLAALLFTLVAGLGPSGVAPFIYFAF